MKNYLKIFAICLCLFANNAFADSARLIAEHKEALTKIENYINSIKGATGKFHQYASDGSSISGNFYLSRPGKMRLDYDFPVEYRLIANDKTLVYYDKKLNQTNFLDMSNVPLSILLNENMSFSNDNLNIVDIQTAPRKIAITIKPNAKGFGGIATVFFDLNPVAIKKWTVIDVQNIKTDIVLDDLNHAIAFEDSFFTIDMPKEKNKIERVSDIDNQISKE